MIGRYGGHVAQYLGDGLLVYFGYPTAHEDDAQRAAHTALEIVVATEGLNGKLQRERSVSLAVRVGIHTGLVVVGEIGGRGRNEQLALGETPNLAARLQTIAESGTVIVSDATRRLLRGAFACYDLGAQLLKGLPTPVRAWRLHGDPPPGPPDSSVTAALTPLVGREQEVELLLERWERVKEGRGQGVLLSGEPGIGKSRLVRVLRERIADEPHTRWECRGSPYRQDSALYPLIELFERALGFGRDEAPAAKLDKVATALRRCGLFRPDTVSLWAALLSMPLPEDYPSLNLTAQRQKQKTFEAVIALLLALAGEQPVVFVVEDLHWIDPSTRDLLGFVVDQIPTARVLVIFTFRPEFHPPWGNRAYLTQLTIDRLVRRQTEAMVERVADGKRLPPEVLQQIIARTDGVPLFVEELTKMILESGLVSEREQHYELARPLPPLAIPATLQDSLMARLDRLAAVKEVAQLGATLGRSFSYELLQAVSSENEDTLRHALARLVEAELVYRRGVPPDATYVFKHALIQEAAYQSLLKSRRQQFHQRIAHVLGERFPETAAIQPELLAHHCTEAGLFQQAAAGWLRAGQRAIDRSANHEAMAHLSRGLEVLKTLPEDPARYRQELDLLTSLGSVVMATKGFGAVEVEDIYTRALNLCRRIDDSSRLSAVLRGLVEFYVLRGDLTKARDLGEQLVSLAGSARSETFLAIAHEVLGATLLWQGEFGRAREQLENAVACYEPARDHSLTRHYAARDSGVMSRCFLAHALWFLGYPDQALNHMHVALSLAKRLAHPFSLALALQFRMLHQYRREPELTEQQAEAGLPVATDQGFPFAAANLTVLRGWARVLQGRSEEGVKEISQGIEAYGATGAEMERSLWLALRADACLSAGRLDEALAVVDEALADADRKVIPFYQAELLRLRGELFLKGVTTAKREAERCFRNAIVTARRQQARSLELRAVMSLSRVRQEQAMGEETRRRLAEIHGWFTEGFGTVDLQEGEALLQRLS